MNGQRSDSRLIEDPKTGLRKSSKLIDQFTTIPSVCARWVILCDSSIEAAREVIEVPEARPVPNTKDYFLGISNLRGEVVGLIDLRRMLNIKERSEIRKRGGDLRIRVGTAGSCN